MLEYGFKTKGHFSEFWVIFGDFTKAIIYDIGNKRPKIFRISHLIKSWSKFHQNLKG